MFYVYILKSVNNPTRFYTGFSSDIKKRLLAHNSGKSDATKILKPWELVYCSVFYDEKKAIAFEKYLKTGSGIAFRNKRLI